MNKRFLFTCAVAISALQACSQAPSNKREKLASGLEYTAAKLDGKPKAEIGDIATFQMKVTCTTPAGKDTLVQSSYSSPKPLEGPVPQPTFKGSWEEGLTLMGPGDSAIFYMKADTLFKGHMEAQRPPFIGKGSEIKFAIKMLTVTKTKEIIEKAKKQLSEYPTRKGLKAESTTSGLMYTVTKAGTGTAPVPGDEVEVHYTGTLMDEKDTKFDSSVDRGTPFKFTLGVGQVIRGWDEGIALLREGGKATLMIPYDLAYGPAGSPPVIPAYAPLAFEVELIKVNKAKTIEGKMAVPGTTNPAAADAAQKASEKATAPEKSKGKKPAKSTAK